MSSQTLKIHQFTFQEKRHGFRSTRSPPAVGLEWCASPVCHRCHAAIRISSKIPKSPHVAAGVLSPVRVLSPQRGAAALGAAAEGQRVCSQVRAAPHRSQGRKACPQWEIIQQKNEECLQWLGSDTQRVKALGFAGFWSYVAFFPMMTLLQMKISISTVAQANTIMERERHERKTRK